jgi:hypothetical protein
MLSQNRDRNKKFLTFYIEEMINIQNIYVHYILTLLEQGLLALLSSPQVFSVVRVALLSSPLVFSVIRVALLSSPLVFSVVRVAQSLVFCVVFC